MIDAHSPEDRWHAVLDGLSRFAGRELALDVDMHRSAAATDHRNRALAQLLHSLDALAADPDETVELYTRQSCVAITAADLARMGATLADGGVHPVGRELVVEQPVCRAVLSVMATAGLYETSGDWLYEIGLPGKSGIGGGMITVSPGKGALGSSGDNSPAAGDAPPGPATSRSPTTGAWSEAATRGTRRWVRSTHKEPPRWPRRRAELRPQHGSPD